MNPTIDRLLNAVEGRPLLIWGARMTGLGFLRFAAKHGLEVVGFVDSDPALQARTIAGLPVRSPEQLRESVAEHTDLLVVVAVSIKEDEIFDTLRNAGLGEDSYLSYSRFCRWFFTIDVVGMCNLRCPSCAHSLEDADYPKGIMPLDDFKKVTGKMVEEVGIVSHVSLYSWGEPFLHPHLDEIIGHTHSLGIAAAVSTNLCIPSSKQIERIVRSSPDYLKISLSGYTPEVYDTTHTGGDVNLVKSNLYRLRYLMDKHSVQMVVDVNYHLYKNNVGDDLERMRALCRELDFVLSTCYANVTPVERLVNYCRGRVDEPTRKLSPLLLVDIDKGLEITKTHRHHPCRFLTNQMNINWDRSVPLCCVCFDRKGSIIVSEDFLRDPLAEIVRKKENHPLCQACSAWGFPPYLLGVNQEEWIAQARRSMETENADPS